MAKKGSKVSSEGLEARKKNLLDWVADHPEGGNLRHGAYSGTIRQRYSDKRTRQGKQLAEIMKGLKEDLGCNGNIPMGAQLILDSIKSKIVVILQIGKYVDRQIELIDPKTGELLPCLGRNFTTYTESLRRDLEALTTIANKKSSRVPSIEEIIAKGKKDEEHDG
jgi:hypothetical protein